MHVASCVIAGRLLSVLHMLMHVMETKCFLIFGTFIVPFHGNNWHSFLFSQTRTHLFSVMQLELPRAQSYSYTADLALTSHINPFPPLWPPNLRAVTTPLNVEAWRVYLQHHPDSAFVQYITSSLAQGFRIGFSYHDHSCSISESLNTEVMKGRLIGPLDPSAYPYVMVSSLGTVPKKHCQDKWRLILDLSHPKGASVKDGIDHTLCSLTYMKVDDIVQQVLSLGK